MNFTSLFTGSAIGLELLSGAFGLLAAEDRAQSLRSQARLTMLESEEEAARYASQAQSFRATQKLKYLKAGVSLEGSPLDILAETARVAAENISAIRAKGRAGAMELKSKAVATRIAARTDFVKSIAQSAQIAAKYGGEAGWWETDTAKTGG